LPRDDIDLASELDRVVEQWAPLAEESGIDLRLGAVPVGTVKTSSLALNEILGNFIDNAISYSPPHSTITVSARTVSAATEITVADQGVGMSDEDRERAFDRFWRGANDTRGAGLGLAIVAQLAENAGMRVELRDGDPGVDAVISIPNQS
jgi:signal transduction histidine kinase